MGKLAERRAYGGAEVNDDQSEVDRLRLQNPYCEPCQEEGHQVHADGALKIREGGRLVPVCRQHYWKHSDDPYFEKKGRMPW